VLEAGAIGRLGIATRPMGSGRPLLIGCWLPLLVFWI